MLSKKDKTRIEAEEKRRIELAKESKEHLHPAKEIVVRTNHGIPALLSFFVPGLGQLVKGQVIKGVLIFIGFFAGLFAFIIPGIIVWIWQIIDAYNN